MDLLELFLGLIASLVILVFISPCCSKEQDEIKNTCLEQCKKVVAVFSKCTAFCDKSDDSADCSYHFCSLDKDIECRTCCLEKAEKKDHDIKSCLDDKYRDPRISADEIWLAHKKQIEASLKKWSMDQDKSLMDDTISISITKDANNEIREIDGTKQRPRIYVDCREKKTDVTVDTGIAPESGYGKKLLTVDVRIRFDKEKPIEEKMYTLRGRNYLRTRNSREAIDIIKKMLEHETMLLEFTPKDSPSKICVFDTSRLSEEIKPLREACGW